MSKNFSILITLMVLRNNRNHPSVLIVKIAGIEPDTFPWRYAAWACSSIELIFCISKERFNFQTCSAQICNAY